MIPDNPVLNYDLIDKSLEQITEGIPPDFSLYLQKHFQQGISEMLGTDVKVEAKIVVDTSSVLSDLISFARTGKSVLSEIAKEPFVRLFAPPHLIEEVQAKIPEICNKKKLDATTMLQAWRHLLLPRITIANINDLLSLTMGLLVVGERDRKDVPFVALAFSIDAQGIMSRDKDIIEQPEIRTWTMGSVRRLLTVFKKGSFSFFVAADMLLPLLKVAFKIGTSILKTILVVARGIGRFFAGLARNVFHTLSGLPNWLKLLLVIGVIIGILYMIVNEGARRKALDFLQAMSQLISACLKQMYDRLKLFLDAIGPFIGFSVGSLFVLSTNIEHSIKQLQLIQKTS
nr:putative toxin-antitoxin system toxin component, PIN family [Candidatus Njordarchaeota archaeon]